MNLFGKAKPKANSGPPVNMQQSIQKLRIASENLDKRATHLEKQIGQCLAIAKQKSAAKDKRGALFQLKRKKMFEKQVEQIEGKKMGLEMQIMAMESAAGNTEVIDAMSSGAKTLNKLMQ